MKVKIGNKIYEASKEPILLILNEQDKKNIANMFSTATKYCAFPDEGYTEEEIREFMKIVNTPNTVTFL